VLEGPAEGLNHRDTESTEIFERSRRISVFSVSLWLNPSLLRVSVVSAVGGLWPSWLVV
jgi:hypothetical protein